MNWNSRCLKSYSYQPTEFTSQDELKPFCLSRSKWNSASCAKCCVFPLLRSGALAVYLRHLWLKSLWHFLGFESLSWLTCWVCCRMMPLLQQWTGKPLESTSIFLLHFVSCNESFWHDHEPGLPLLAAWLYPDCWCNLQEKYHDSPMHMELSLFGTCPWRLFSDGLQCLALPDWTSPRKTTRKFCQ